MKKTKKTEPPSLRPALRPARPFVLPGVVTLTGDVGAVTAAVRAASNAIKENGFLVDQLVLPAPHHGLRSLVF